MYHNIKLSLNKKYLEYDDGRPFFWLADTWWYGVTSRMSFEIFKKLAKTRKKQGFSVIQIVVGIPPETEPFSNNALNDGGYPFTKNWRVNANYFREVDEKIKYLVESGLIPCLVGNWGNHIDVTGVDNMKKFWAEVVKHYASYPVIFCLTGEVDKFSGINNIFSGYFLRRRLKKWDEVAKHIKKIDPHHHLLTVHVQSQQSARQLFHDPSWLDINSIQSGHSKDRAAFMIETILHESKKSRPVINLEPWYEGILNNFGAQEQRYAFWTCILSGAKGHTYGAHGVWQMATKDDNFMNHWGHSNWEEAIKYQGAEQLGRAKKFLEKFAWWRLSPCFELVSPPWTKLNPDRPLAAYVENEYIFVYFPKIDTYDEFSFNLTGFTPAKIWQIDPITMEIFKKSGCSNQKLRLAFPEYPKNHDLLLVFHAVPNT